MKRDTPIIGFIIGALLPIIGYLIVYSVFKAGSQSLSNFTQTYISQHKLFAKLITLSILINLIPFAYCNFKRYDYIARGVFIATMLYVVFVILMMFVW